MSALSEHSRELPPLKAFRLSFPLSLALIVLVSLGAIGFYLIASVDSTRAWFNLLIGASLFTGFGLFGLFMLIINNVVNARWHIVVRRIYEAMAATLPIAAVLCAIVYAGRHHIYEWTNAEIVANDPIIQGKAAFLNEDFFLLRLIIYFAIWIFAAAFLIYNSLKQDQTGSLVHTVRNKYASRLFLVLYALSVSFFAFDLLMSVEPHWFSTIYGVLYFAMFFQAGHALTVLTTWYLNKPGYFKGYVNEKHLHDLGKWVFAFSIFWAYIAFSQFMLYWYGDLYEETMWYQYRMKEGWEWVGLSVLILRWVLPFLVLMPFAFKKASKVVIPVCLLVLYGHWMDVFWNIMPAIRLMQHGHGTETTHYFSGYEWQDVLSGFGFIALFVLAFGVILQGMRLIPTRDPRLEDSLHHH